MTIQPWSEGVGKGFDLEKPKNFSWSTLCSDGEESKKRALLIIRTEDVSNFISAGAWINGEEGFVDDLLFVTKVGTEF